ncbi:MAG: DUF3791 domain-containing protein [Treponema sp.]
MTDANQIKYTVACVNEFSKSKKLSPGQAFAYLQEHKGMDFLVEFYDVEHTLSFDDVIEDLTRICLKNGGEIQ